MQNLIILIVAAFFVYLLFFRKGGMGSGMGMGCCGGHGSHGDHSSHDRYNSHGGHCGTGAEPDKGRHLNDLTEDRKGDVIDLREDQYTVLPVEEDQQSETIERLSISKTH
jgi:hypothetical protein